MYRLQWSWDMKMSLLERCPHFRRCYVQASMELGHEDLSLLERCPHFRGCYVQASMELGPEDVSLLERCPHFRGCYVQASVELGPEDVSLLERCPHFRGCYVQASMELGTEDVSLLEVSSFQRVRIRSKPKMCVSSHVISRHLSYSYADAVLLTFCHYRLSHSVKEQTLQVLIYKTNS